MKPFRSVTARAAVLDRPDVDTDQIIPKQFLKRIQRTGYGEFLFFDWMKEPAFENDRLYTRYVFSYNSTLPEAKDARAMYELAQEAGDADAMAEADDATYSDDDPRRLRLLRLERLAPVYEACAGKISYNELRGLRLYLLCPITLAPVPGTQP